MPRRRISGLGLASRRARLRAASSFLVGGGYEGARTDRAATRNWMPRIGSPDSDTIPDLIPLRARTRDLARNAPLVAGAINTHLTSIIGPGLVPHPRIDRELLGLTDAEADKWQKQAARIWWTVAGGTQLDIRRRLNFAHLSWVVLRSWFLGGDVYYRRRFKERSGDILGLKVQLIEGDRVSNPDDAFDTETLIEGHALDADGETTGFWVADRHPGDLITLRRRRWSLQPAFGPDTGEPLMRQIALLERDGQTRGVSVFAPVLEVMKQITRWTSAELDTTVASSFIMAVLTTQDANGLQSMGTGINQPPVGFQGAATSAAANRQIELAPAAVPQLLPGEELKAWNPERPNSAFDPFFRIAASMVGVAVDLPHELLIKQFTSSFSASKAALNEAWRGFTTKRSLVVLDQWAQPIYEDVISEAVARGYLEAPGYFDDPLVRQAYNESQWTGPIMGFLNPLQEVQAAQARVDMGISTLEEETAQLTGGDDWERKNAQQAKERRMRREAGLDQESVAQRIDTETVSTQVPTPDEQDAKERQDANGGSGANNGQ